MGRYTRAMGYFVHVTRGSVTKSTGFATPLPPLIIMYLASNSRMITSTSDPTGGRTSSPRISPHKNIFIYSCDLGDTLTALIRSRLGQKIPAISVKSFIILKTYQLHSRSGAAPFFQADGEGEGEGEEKERGKGWVFT